MADPDIIGGLVKGINRVVSVKYSKSILEVSSPLIADNR